MLPVKMYEGVHFSFTSFVFAYDPFYLSQVSLAYVEAALQDPPLGIVSAGWRSWMNSSNRVQGQVVGSCIRPFRSA